MMYHNMFGSTPSRRIHVCTIADQLSLKEWYGVAISYTSLWGKCDYSHENTFSTVNFCKNKTSSSKIYYIKGNELFTTI